MSGLQESKLKVFIGSDHAGYELKQKFLTKFLNRVEWTDCGTNSTDSVDYPIFGEKVARQVLGNPGSLALLLCGSGIGVCIAANKVAGIRAASVSDPITAQLAREHNDAQILCLGARVISAEKAFLCFDAFLDGKFDKEHTRHGRRIQEIADIEKRESGG